MDKVDENRFATHNCECMFTGDCPDDHCDGNQVTVSEILARNHSPDDNHWIELKIY